MASDNSGPGLNSGSQSAAQTMTRDVQSRSFATWLDSFTVGFLIDRAKVETAPRDVVVYILDVNDEHKLVLSTMHARRLSTGEVTDATGIFLGKYSHLHYVNEQDVAIALLFASGRDDESWTATGSFPEMPELCELLITRLIQTGRCYWRQITDVPLRLRKSKPASLQWRLQSGGRQRLEICSIDPEDVTVIAGMPWFVNPGKGALGQLNLNLPADAVKKVLESPLLEPFDAQAVSNSLTDLALPIPLPKADFHVNTILVTPVPCLLLRWQPRYSNPNKSHHANDPIPVAVVSFDYGNLELNSSDVHDCRSLDADKLVVYKKHVSAEKKRLKELYELGLRAHAEKVLTFPNGNSSWIGFVEKDVERLESNGWKIDVSPSFGFKAIHALDDWFVDAAHGGDFWFSLDLGVDVEGKKIPLLPIICEAVQRLPRFNPLSSIDLLNQEGLFYACLDDGRYLAIPFERLKVMLQVLLQMFDRAVINRLRVTKQERLELSLPQLSEVAKVFDCGWVVSDAVTNLQQRIKDFEGVKEVEPPESFAAELRPYQLEGLAWLGFISEFKLGGVLADDMGLGKTVQTLAHIEVERAANRLDKPFLIVCPTSVLPNWLSEIAKFTPALKVATLWGSNRLEKFNTIEGSHVVLTTYPLVARDFKELSKHSWKAVILDEAQMIKNPNTLATQALLRLRSDYRLCLTGTPIENHLGELWSQFNFLLPGYLKDLSSFTANFKTPIEKHRDFAAQKLLSSTVRPFILRRTKEHVAKDLPPKTTIVRRVELDVSQRDLYETVRASMYERVKDALNSRGLAKSQVIILDALLKLRQICCDPRLASKAVSTDNCASAKLQLLLDMIEELLAEKRRVLLFSQFTSMLDLVAPELRARNIGFVQLRGDTRDRSTPVIEFQQGKVPLFLLSLKAGGLGLNLTAADTVIHYDPWWNPAVENQATDRAHRIGQQKSVFEFKLVAANTIEERMLELQEKKKEIAGVIFDDEGHLPFEMTAQDIERLFLPTSDS